MTDAKKRMAMRLFKELRPTTDHGDQVVLHDFEADTLADIIAEYVATVMGCASEPTTISGDVGADHQDHTG